MKHIFRSLIVIVIVLAGSGGVALAGGNGFAINLSASARFARIGLPVTITATTNADVGPTPYYISVYDQTSRSELAVCGYGTSCSATVSEHIWTTHSFQAYVGDYPPSNSPPGFIITSSPVVYVTWRWWFIIPYPSPVM